MRDLFKLFYVSVSVYLVSCQNDTTTITEANTEVSTVASDPSSSPTLSSLPASIATTAFPTQRPAQLLEYVRSYLDHWLHGATSTRGTTERPTRPGGGGGGGWSNNRPPIVPGSHSAQRTSNYGTRQQYLQFRNGKRYDSQSDNFFI